MLTTGTRIRWYRMNGNFSFTSTRFGNCTVCETPPALREAERRECGEPWRHFGSKLDTALAASDVLLLGFGAWYNEDEPGGVEAFRRAVSHAASRLAEWRRVSRFPRLGLLSEAWTQHYESVDGSGTFARRVPARCFLAL